MPRYDAFISYSHVDGVVARLVHRGLHQIARRPGRLRALSVFRDSTELSASPNLWANVVEAMEDSRYLVLILSPASASSTWVGREVDHWVSERSTDQVLLVLAGGSLTWDDDRRCFDRAASTAAPSRLTEPGAFTSEPLYIDLREAASSQLDSMFLRERITELAAPIHGKSKSELFSEDARELRRFRILRRAFIAGLVTLSVGLAGVAVLALRAQHRANHERDVAVGRILMQESESTGDADAGLSKLESVAAWRMAPSTASYSGMLEALRRPGLAALTGHSGTVRGVAVDPTGRRVASVGSDGTLRLWDLQRRRQLAVLEDEQDGINAVAFSPDGTKIAAGGSDGQVRVFDVVTRRRIGGFAPSRGADRVMGVQFDPASNEVAAVALDGSLTWWDSKTRHRTRTEQLGDDLWSLAYAHDGSLAVAGQDTGTIRLLSRTGRQRVVVPSSGTPRSPSSTAVYSLTVSPDGRLLAATADGKVEFFGTGNGKHLGDIRVNATTAAFTPDGTHLLTGNQSGSVWAWRLDDAAEVCNPTGGTGPVLGVTVLRAGRTAVTAGADGALRLWSLDPCLPTHRLVNGPEDIASTSAWSPDGGRLVTLASGALRLWNPANGRLIRSLDAQLPDHVAYDPDGTHVVVTEGTPSGYRVVRVDVRTNARRDLFHLADASVDAVAAAPQGDTVAVAAAGTGRHSRSVRVISTRDDIPARPLDTNPVAETVALAYSPNGHLLAAGGSDSSIELWDPRSGYRLARAVTSKESAKAVDTANPMRAVTFSPDGQVLATGGADRRIRLWSVAGGRLHLTATFDPASSTILSLSFSPDGQVLASGSLDGATRLWDTASGRAVGEALLGHESAGPDFFNSAAVEHVAFAPDGGSLATTGVDGHTDLWDIQGLVGNIAGALCRAAGTELGLGQWRTVTGQSSTYRRVC